MILMRRKWGANASMFKEIGVDLKMIATRQGGAAVQRAEDRRKVWVKLPYGIPLCVGFLLYLGYVLILVA
jgi:prepilin peptidase CpaA